MNDKILVKVIVPELDNTFDVIIPVNEMVWKIKKIILKCISDILDVEIDLDKSYVLMNIQTLKRYGNNEVVISTDIRNGAELLMFSQK